MQDSKIEWTDATWNPLRGCTAISPGCAHCYAATIAARFSGVGQPYEGLAYFDANGKAHWTGKVREAPDKIAEPLRWKKPRKVFVNSMSDLFHEDVTNEYIAAVFGAMAASPQHTYQVLTKRADRLPNWFAWVERETKGRFIHPALAEHAACNGGGDPLFKAANRLAGKDQWPLPNVWIGVSIEDRRYGLPRVELLRQVPAAVRFLSVEPLLEDLGEIDLTGIGWVIVGGESGHGGRPMDPRWVRSIRDQCQAASVPFLFKQWGEWAPTSTFPAEIPSGTCCSLDDSASDDDWLWKVGKKSAGRLLDGRTWDQLPQLAGVTS